jgi:D-alanyl-lipoteichoic acid acyltransferase DltB (MBOAT superfamily)
VAYYSIYRIIHYYIEVQKNSSFKHLLFDYLFYILFFPCLCHGPIERINTLVFKNITYDDVLYGVKKFFLGLIKINLYFYLLKDLENISIAELWKMYIKTINFYLLITGDWDVVVGVSRWLGFNVRENIPKSFFLQSSLTKLWRNGNATLIDWYFSYMYIPLAKNGKWMNLKLISVFTLILGMHAFFNTVKFPSLNVICYYILMGAWFGVTLVISKEIDNYFKKKEVKKAVSHYPEFVADIIYRKSMIRYIVSIVINFNIFALGMWYSPFYTLITMTSGRTP